MNPIQTISENCMVNDDFGEGKIIFSQMKSYYRPLQKSSLSIKLVLEGKERYVVNGQRYEVKAGQFLVVNNQSEVEINFKEKNIAKGLCFYPPTTLVQDVYAQQNYTQEQLLDSTTSTSSHAFTEKIYQLSENKFGVFLQQSSAQLLQHKTSLQAYDFNQFYFQLAENLVQSQAHINQKIAQLPALKKQTQEELFRRVSLVRNYIEETYQSKINLEELAQMACLSKFHLIRSYKSIYGQSPYQHILKKRLDLAQILLQKGQSSLEEITLATGFSDAKNLKKALKKLK